MAAGTHVDGLPELGRTLYGPTQDIPSSFAATILLEGVEKEFPDIRRGQSAGVKVQSSGLKRVAVLMRNAGAATVNAGDVVVMETAYFGRRHNGKSGSAGIAVAGVIDPLLNSLGCRVGDMCWVFVEGPTEVNKATGDVTQGNRLLCTNDGKAAEYDSTPDDAAEAQQNSLLTFGTVMETTTTDPAYCLAYLRKTW